MELEEETLSNINATNNIGNANDQAAEVVKVKQEPLEEEEEEEEGSVSAVLRSKVILFFILCDSTFFNHVFSFRQHF